MKYNYRDSRYYINNQTLQIRETYANIFNMLSMVESALNNQTLQMRETYVNMFNTLSMVESALNGKRYWIDVLGRPRRSPLARPLLHKGRKGKKHG